MAFAGSGWYGPLRFSMQSCDAESGARGGQE